MSDEPETKTPASDRMISDRAKLLGPDRGLLSREHVGDPLPLAAVLGSWVVQLTERTELADKDIETVEGRIQDERQKLLELQKLRDALVDERERVVDAMTRLYPET